MTSQTSSLVQFMRFLCVMIGLCSEESLAQTKHVSACRPSAPNHQEIFDATHEVSVAILQDGSVKKYVPFVDGAGSINEVMSITKSVTALLAGIAMSEGLLSSLDEPLENQFPSLQQYPYKSETLRHVLQQDSCFDVPPSMSQEEYWSRANDDHFALLAMVQPSCKRDRAFSYSNLMPNVVSQVIALATGEPMEKYAQRKLFAPLGIKNWYWYSDREGHSAAGAGLKLTALDLAKIGQLILQDGIWEGKAIVPSSFIEELYKPSTNHPNYSLLWWLRESPGGSNEEMKLQGDGWAGQSLIIDRQSKRVTAVLTRPEWAWELYSKGCSFDEATTQYNREMEHYEPFLQRVLAEP